MKGSPRIFPRSSPTPHPPRRLASPHPLLPLRIACLALALLALSGCMDGQRKVLEDPDLRSLMDAYRQQHALALEQERQRQQHGILRLDVTPDRMVSVHLERALLSVVVYRLLEDRQVPYLLAREALLRGRVTARFENLPLVRALNVLLQTQGLTATERDGLLVIDEAEAAPAAPEAKAEGEGPSAGARPGVVSTSLALHHTPADTAAAYLHSIYTGVPSDVAVGVAEEPSRNAVALLGPPAAVRKAAGLLRQADREPAHVFIEVLVVELDSSSLLELGTDLTDFRARTADAASVLDASQITFAYLQNAGAITRFKVVLEALMDTSRARLISRPYLMTVSNREARIAIGDERHVITQQVSGGVVVTATEPVEGGIRLTMLPKVLADEKIQLAVAVEDSQFVSTGSPNIAVIKDKNQATTVVQVGSGQSVVIGGLVLDRRSGENRGFPWLRKVPLLNLLFARQVEQADKQEVLVLVTPYIWQPGLSSPLPAPGAFRMPELREPPQPSDPWWAP